MLDGECIWHFSHLRPNHPPETSNRQGHLYYHICLLSPSKSNLPDAKKDNFYDELCSVVLEIPTWGILILFGDWNGHVGKSSARYEGMHGWHGWDTKIQMVRVYWSLLCPATWSSEIAKQHHLLVCGFRADIPPPAKKKIVTRLRTWRLRETEAQRK